jgi:hypothetical protein
MSHPGKWATAMDDDRNRPTRGLKGINSKAETERLEAHLKLIDELTPGAETADEYEANLPSKRGAADSD